MRGFLMAFLWMLVAAGCFFAAIFSDWIERPLWAIAGAIFVLASTQVDPS